MLGWNRELYGYDGDLVLVGGGGEGVVLFRGGIGWMINMYLTGHYWECQITTVSPRLNSLAWGSYTMNFGSEFSWLP